MNDEKKQMIKMTTTEKSLFRANIFFKFLSNFFLNSENKKPYTIGKELIKPDNFGFQNKSDTVQRRIDDMTIDIEQ